MKLISNSISHPVFRSLSFVVSSGKKKKQAFFILLRFRIFLDPHTILYVKDKLLLRH